MKRLLMIVIALLVVFQFAAADQTVTLMKESGKLEVTLNLADKDLIQVSETGISGISRVTVSRQGCADVSISVAYADMDTDLSLNDADEATTAQILAVLSAEYPNGLLEVRKTQSGNRYFYVNENIEYDLRDVFTLYKGFYIELVQYQSDFSALTAKDETFLMDVLQGIWTR